VGLNDNVKYILEAPTFDDALEQAPPLPP